MGETQKSFRTGWNPQLTSGGSFSSSHSVALEKVGYLSTTSHKSFIVHLPLEVHYSMEMHLWRVYTVSEVELMAAELKTGVLPELCVKQSKMLKSLRTPCFRNRLSLTYWKTRLGILLTCREEYISKLRKERRILAVLFKTWVECDWMHVFPWASG